MNQNYAGYSGNEGNGNGHWDQRYSSDLSVAQQLEDDVDDRFDDLDDQRESSFGASRGDHSSVFAKMDLVQAVDRSCSCCRIRKVRCDRSYPICMRCSKRKEVCDYGTDFAMVMRPARDPKKGLKNGPSASTFVQAFDKAVPPPPATQIVATNAPNPVPGARRVSVSTGRAYTVGGPDDYALQWKLFLETADLGPTSSNWRIAQPVMASSLTRHLIDASMHSCCFHLPAFHAFSDRVDYLKSHLDDGHLDIPSQAIVSVLASLGARASPHSALLGVAGPDVEMGTVSKEVVATAGKRRQKAWQAISNRAIELCSQSAVLQHPSRANAETLVAVAQMLLFADVKPIRARFFLRNALGLYEDLLSSPDLTPSAADDIRKAIGPTLFEADARAAAYTSMPYLISDRDFQKYFSGAVRLPDPTVENLSQELSAIFSAEEITRYHVDKALASTSLYVCAIQRTYAQIASPRKALDLLTGIPSLWASGDSCHTAAQQLHRTLAQLDYIPAGFGDDHSYDILIGIRLDARIIDVFNLAHSTMLLVRKTTDDVGEQFALDTLIGLSEKRVRKCLKLSAFYSKCFVDSFDKHLVYHLLVQLEVIPWVSIAVQRVGEPGGPTSAEFEVSETELDWFEKALELGCFYLPLASARLDELREARDNRRFAVVSRVDDSTQARSNYAQSPTESLPTPSTGSGAAQSRHSSHSQHVPPYPSSSTQHSHLNFLPHDCTTHSSHSHPPSHLPTPAAYFPPVSASPPSNIARYLFDSYGTPSFLPPSSGFSPRDSSDPSHVGQDYSLSPQPTYNSWGDAGNYSFDTFGNSDYGNGKPNDGMNNPNSQWPATNYGATPEGPTLNW